MIVPGEKRLSMPTQLLRTGLRSMSVMDGRPKLKGLSHSGNREMRLHADDDEPVTHMPVESRAVKLG